MALYLPLCKFVDSSETIVAPSAVITDEGQALVVSTATGANQSAGVTPSLGATTEKFAGFSFAGTSATPFVPTYGLRIENFYTPALTSNAAIFNLAYTPTDGSTPLVYNVTTGKVLVAYVANTTSGYSINGKVLTITNAYTNATPPVALPTAISQGDVIQVTYKYNWTVLQARARAGDVQPGGYVGNYVGQIGLVKRGIIYTDEIDTSINWATATGVNLGAIGTTTTGILTSGTPNSTVAGVTIGIAINARIISLPTESVPFLGIEFST